MHDFLSIFRYSTQISFFTQVLSRGQCEFRFRHRVQKARRREGLRDFDLHNDRNRPKPRRARAFCRRFFSKRSSICTIFCRFFATGVGIEKTPPSTPSTRPPVHLLKNLGPPFRRPKTCQRICVEFCLLGKKQIHWEHAS